VRRWVFILTCALGAALLVAPARAPCAVGSGALKPFLEYIESKDRYLDTQHPATDPRQQFIVYAKDAKRAKQVLAVAVRHRHRAQQFFGTSVIWMEPAVILVYPNGNAYHRSWGMYGTGGVQIQARYRGKGVKLKLVVTYEGELLLERTLPHELMHLLITDMSNRGYFDGKRGEMTPTPVWIQEGLAEYLTADAERRENFEKFFYWSLHKQEQIPLARLLEQMRYDRRAWLHYAQSYSFIAFVAATVPDGRLRLRNYITSYDDPARAKDRMQIFNLTFVGVAPSIEQLERRWHAWVRARYARHFSPVVLRTKPADHADDAAADGRIWVQFDKPIDASTLSAKTMALRAGTSKELGDDEENLLQRASFKCNKSATVLLIEVTAGLRPSRRHTLALSDHVKDAHGHVLVAEKFEEMERDDWWKSAKPEPAPGDKQAKKPEEAAPPKLVHSITFKTRAKETDSAGGDQ
jgi:hypothetical protein